MWELATRAADHFVPRAARNKTSDYLMVRTFVFLHLFGPLLGHSVIVFLYQASDRIGWVFWTIEANLCFFWLMPILVKRTGSLTIPAALSVQALVTLSLFGSFFYGGMSSPFLPWILIALLLGFFYLADRPRLVLIGVGLQLAIFAAAHLWLGEFPLLVPLKSLWLVNLISIVSALIYMTFVALYYENVMRESSLLEEAAAVQREKAEQLRQAMLKAAEASDQKSIFLAKMSHELRTPLNAVIGYSEMLRDELAGGSASNERAADLERINAAGRHLLDLVTGVLDLTSIESDKQDAALQKVEVSQIIRDVAATAGPLIAKKHNQLIIQMPADLGTIETDPLKLRQCILNLLSNAAKFTTHGTIRLRVAKKAATGGDRLTIEVTDTGIGMSKESLSRIFQSFSQAEADTTQKFG